MHSDHVSNFESGWFYPRQSAQLATGNCVEWHVCFVHVRRDKSDSWHFTGWNADLSELNMHSIDDKLHCAGAELDFVAGWRFSREWEQFGVDGDSGRTLLCVRRNGQSGCTERKPPASPTDLSARHMHERHFYDHRQLHSHDDIDIHSGFQPDGRSVHSGKSDQRISFAQ